MSNTLLINSAGYVQSQNIKVFPCAYRGYYEEPTEGNTDPTYKIINPEARTTSEYSFVNSYHKLSATKESYVISWTPSAPGASNGVLKFVIGGYYFEITNCTLDDFIEIENGNRVSKKFYINVKNNGNLPGQYLGSFVANARWLDIDTGGNNNLEDFYFTGLKIVAGEVSSENSIVYSLTPFASQYQHWKSANSDNLEEALNEIEALTTTEKNLLYYTDEDTNNYSAYSDLLNPTTASFSGVVTFYKQIFDISPAALPITNLLDSGSGKYSLRVLEEVENGTDNTTKAIGDYSVALGKRTEASGLVSTALGNLTKASGEASLAIGNITEASGINSFASGNNTQAQGASSVTTGSYTQTLEDNSFAGGQNTRANGVNSFAFGENTIATGRNATSVGYKAPNTLDVGAYGQNSITAGTDTKTTTAATNAVAIGNTTIAAGVNSFVGGNHSEANNENSFAFGNNVKTTANNQVVFGAYNEEDDDQAFIIANGTSTTKSNKFTVSYDGDVKALGTATIEGTTTINNSLTTKGNIISNKTDTSGVAANNLILGSNEGGSSGTITIYGSTVNTKVFEVTNTGNATITGPINFTDTTGYSSSTTGEGENAVTTYSAALKVGGGVHIGQKLNVNNTTTLGSTLSVTGATSISNTTECETDPNFSNVKAALKVAGGVHIGKKLNVASDTTIVGTTNISGVTSIINDTEYTAAEGETPLAAALKVTGGMHVGKKLNVVTDATIGGTLTTTGNTILGGNSTTNVVNIKTNPTGEDVNVKITGSTVITNTTTIQGAVGITKDDESNSKTTGALIVTGGVGIGKNLNVGNDLKIAGNLITTTAGKYVKFNNGITNSEAYLQVNGTAEIANDLTLREDLFVKGHLKLTGSSSTSLSTFELLDTNSSPVVQLTTTEAKLPETDITGNLYLSGTLTADDDNSEHQIGSIKITDGAITGVSTLTASGTITANIFNATYVNTSSDRRLKQNIEDYKCEKSILDLPIKKYEYISDPTKTQIGCIAQDLQKICPELVSENENGYLLIQESKLIYLLLQEVKKLKEKVESLERR